MVIKLRNNPRDTRADLEKELYISTVVSSLRNNVPADIAFSLANNLLIYFHTFRPNPQTIDRDEMIKQHLKDSQDVKVVSIDTLSSVSAIPQTIGDYTVTEDILNSAASFIQNDGANHYLVHTNDSSKVFIVRTNTRDKKVLQAKDILKILEGFYVTFQQRLGNASNLLFNIESGIEEDVHVYKGKIHEANKTRFSSSLETAKKHLGDAKTSLNKLGKATDYYRERDFLIQDGCTSLATLHETSEGIERKIHSLPIYSPPLSFSRRQSLYR